MQCILRSDQYSFTQILCASKGIATYAKKQKNNSGISQVFKNSTFKPEDRLTEDLQTYHNWFEMLIETFGRHEGAITVAKTLAMDSLPDEYLISYFLCYNFADLRYSGCLSSLRCNRIYFGPRLRLVVQFDLFGWRHWWTYISIQPSTYETWEIEFILYCPCSRSAKHHEDSIPSSKWVGDTRSRLSIVTVVRRFDAPWQLL